MRIDTKSLTLENVKSLSYRVYDLRLYASTIHTSFYAAYLEHGFCLGQRNTYIGLLCYSVVQ